MTDKDIIAALEGRAKDSALHQEWLNYRKFMMNMDKVPLGFEEFHLTMRALDEMTEINKDDYYVLPKSPDKKKKLKTYYKLDLGSYYPSDNLLSISCTFSKSSFTEGKQPKGFHKTPLEAAEWASNNLQEFIEQLQVMQDELRMMSEGKINVKSIEGADPTLYLDH